MALKSSYKATKNGAMSFLEGYYPSDNEPYQYGNFGEHLFETQNPCPSQNTPI